MGGFEHFVGEEGCAYLQVKGTRLLRLSDIFAVCDFEKSCAHISISFHLFSHLYSTPPVSRLKAFEMYIREFFG